VIFFQIAHVNYWLKEIALMMEIALARSIATEGHMGDGDSVSSGVPVTTIVESMSTAIMILSFIAVYRMSAHMIVIVWVTRHACTTGAQCE